jgi:hypothetical protein
MSREDPIM